jgi:WD40 repeat protein/serine/threonine protein kinase
MPAAATTGDFVQLVAKSGLVEPEELTRHFDALATEGEMPDSPAALAERLIQDGLLTAFQTRFLLRGKYKGLLIGRYKVLQPLGVGGTGHVYLCEHRAMGHRVAIKLLTGVRKDNFMVVERFFREACAAAALDHPNLVKAHDIGHDGNYYYLVMDYVEGISLHELVGRHGPLTPERAAHYVAQAASGLRHLHEAGLVHRDIKPANLLLNRQGTIKILDLGLACFLQDRKASLTQKYEGQAILGTADYLAPEQALNSTGVDQRADLYSLGATLYFLLAGHAPFEGSPVPQKILQQVNAEPEPLERVRPGVPAELAGMVRTLMAKDKGMRFASAGAVVQALAPWTRTPIPPPAEELVPVPRRPAPRSNSGSLGRNAILCDTHRPAERNIRPTPPPDTVVQAPPAKLTKRTTARRPSGPRPARARSRVRVWGAAGGAGVLVLIAATLWVALARSPRDPAVSAAAPVPAATLAVPGLASLVGGQDKRANSDTLSVKPMRTFEGHTGPVESVVFTPDGRQAISGGHDRILRVWDVATGLDVVALEGHRDQIHSVSIAADGRSVLTSGRDRTARLWDLRAGAEVRRFEGHTDALNGAAFSPDGRWVITAAGNGWPQPEKDYTLRLWETATGKEVRRFEGHTQAIWATAFAADGRHILSGSFDGSARLWDVQTGQELRRFESSGYRIHAVAMAADSQRIATAGADKVVRLWDIRTSRTLQAFEGHTDVVAAVAISPDGNRILSGADDRTVRLWDTVSGRELATLLGHTDSVWGVTFSPDGHWALSASKDRTLRLWRLP